MKAKERVFNNVTEQRRKMMSKIRGKNTTIEVTLQRLYGQKDIDIERIIKGFRGHQIFA